MDRTSTTVSVPSLDEWIGNHGCEEDIFLYLLKWEENSMYEITLRSNTGNRGRDLRDIPLTSADAGTEPQNHQTSSSSNDTPSESEDEGGPIEGHDMDPIPSSDSSSVCDTSVDDPITPEDDVVWVEDDFMDPCPF